jgi:hypothetical protein
VKRDRDQSGTSIVAQELAWLDRLRAKLEPEIEGAVATLVHLSKNSARDQVRAMASAKIVSLYAQCAADSAKLKLQSGDEDDEDGNKVRVVVVTQEQLGEASQALSADYQARRLAAKQDVS